MCSYYLEESEWNEAKGVFYAQKGPYSYQTLNWGNI